jgi:hypothetical protein
MLNKELILVLHKVLVSKTRVLSIPLCLGAIILLLWAGLTASVLADAHALTTDAPPTHQQIAKLIASDGEAKDEFGWSVAVSGDTLVVGAYLDDDNGNKSGSAYVFERNHGRADNWGQVVKLLASDGDVQDQFGWSVAISEDTLVAGAYQNKNGIQFSLVVTDTHVLAPAASAAPTVGNLIPSGSITSVVASSAGWDFVLTAPLSPTPPISGTGAIVTLPFMPHNTGCVTLTFTTHALSNGQARPISHAARDASVCVEHATSDVRGNIYLDWRSSGHYTNTQVTLIGPHATYTTTTQPNGDFAFDDVTTSNYTLQAGHALFVRATRAITLLMATPTFTLSPIGLWAGDIDQDRDIDLCMTGTCWRRRSCLSVTPTLDINADEQTDIYDLIILENNRGQSDMTMTNPPVQSKAFANSLGDKATIEAENIVSLFPRDSGENIVFLPLALNK